ncbi:hypothetical protein [Micromonospora tulbaghiae]|uniref:hypothetical protein n=1 Tax=Micromonospora tulbaghiae TaxID=479978 RepID=UPI00341C9DFB
MDGDDRFSLLVQRLYDVHMALEFLARSSVRPEWFEARDVLAHEVLAGAAERLSRLLNRQVSVDELKQLGQSEALSLLTPGLMLQQDAARAALRKTLDDQFRRRTAGQGQAGLDPDVRPNRWHPLVSIALGVGISVLAATAAAPIAALAVQEPITRELVKAAITGVVSGTVTEVARPKLADQSVKGLSDRVSDLERQIRGLLQPPSPNNPQGPQRAALPSDQHGQQRPQGPQRAALPSDQHGQQRPGAGRAKPEPPKSPGAEGPRFHGP